MKIFGIEEKKYFFTSDDDGEWTYFNVVRDRETLFHVGDNQLASSDVNKVLGSDFDEYFDSLDAYDQACEIERYAFEEMDHDDEDGYYISFCRIVYVLRSEVFASKEEAQAFIDANRLEDAAVVQLAPTGKLASM